MGENFAGWLKWRKRNLYLCTQYHLLFYERAFLGKFLSTYQRVLGGDIQKSLRRWPRCKKRERKKELVKSVEEEPAKSEGGSKRKKGGRVDYIK